MQVYAAYVGGRYLSALDAEAVVVEPKDLESVAARALQKLHQTDHAVGTESVITQVQLKQICLRSDHTVAHMPLKSAAKQR